MRTVSPSIVGASDLPNSGDAVQPGVNLPPEASVPPIKRFAALTALQYERFALWKDGKFGSNAVPWKDATELKDVELKYQPACLTLAALDHTIGDPLCPGIEVWRVAKDPRTYVLEVDTDKHRIDPPFRVDHEVMAPGYLTRGLSIPWQSDFHQCHTHWYVIGTCCIMTLTFKQVAEHQTGRRS